MIPTVIPVADVFYRSFYDEQEYRLRMRQLAGYGSARDDAVYDAPRPASRIAAVGSRLRAAGSAAISAVLSL